MSGKSLERKSPMQIAIGGTLLGFDGNALEPGVRESAVYLGTDGFVYQVSSHQAQSHIQHTITGKRSIGEYLRWVDGLFRPGELPSEANGIHYRAARVLRELI